MLRSSTGAAAGGLQEKGVEIERVVWMWRANFSSCGKEVKARVSLSPLQKLKGHLRGKFVLRLLLADGLSVDTGHCRKTGSWANAFDTAILAAAQTVSSLCFLFTFPPEDFTAPAQHLDPITPGMWAAVQACNNQASYALTLHFPFPHLRLKGKDNLEEKCQNVLEIKDRHQSHHTFS